MTASSFPFAFDPHYARAGRVFGVRPDTTGILVGDGRLTARFGPWHIDTELSNIDTVDITGPYAFVKTAGPARLGVTDRGLTFATNGRAGVTVTFTRAITGIDPAGWIHHPNLTLTPGDVTGLAELLSSAVADAG